MAGSRRLQAGLGAETGSFYGVATSPQPRLPSAHGASRNQGSSLPGRENRRRSKSGRSWRARSGPAARADGPVSWCWRSWRRPRNAAAGARTTCAEPGAPYLVRQRRRLRRPRRTSPRSADTGTGLRPPRGCPDPTRRPGPVVEPLNVIGIGTRPERRAGPAGRLVVPHRAEPDRSRPSASRR